MVFLHQLAEELPTAVGRPVAAAPLGLLGKWTLNTLLLVFILGADVITVLSWTLPQNVSAVMIMLTSRQSVKKWLHLVSE